MSALLALFLRSLRAETRSRLTYALRATLGVAVLLIIVGTHRSTGWLGAPGLKIFGAVTYLDLFIISLAGLSYFASAVAEEKEDMTLGLLRMTNLSPLSILFGKSTSRLVGALLLLAAQAPFTLLAVVLGGVTTPQILAAYACLGAYLFLLANLALVFSVVAARTSTATFFAGCALVFFWSGPNLAKGTLWVLGRLGLIASPTPGPGLAEFLDGWWNITPLPRLWQIMQTGFHDSAWCPQVGASLAFGVGFFLLAWALFHRGAERAIDPEPKRLFVSRAKGGRGRRGAGRAWKHALLWKDFHFLSGGKLAFAAKCVICVAAAAFFAWRIFATPVPPPQNGTVFSFTSLFTRALSNRTGQPWLDFGSSLTMWLSIPLWLELVFAASRVLRLERRWQTLSSLAVLPMSMRRVAWQKIFGCLLGALPWVIFVAFGYVCTLIGWWNYHPPSPANGMVTYVQQPTWMTVSAVVLSLAGDALLLHVIAALSLWLKWGALPFGLVCFYILQAVMFLFAMLFFQQAGFVIVAIAECLAVGVLHVQIGRRLDELVSED